MHAIWSEIKSAIKTKVPDHSFRMWLEPVQSQEDAGESLTLWCPNLFYKKRLVENYLALIQTEADRIAGRKVQVTLEVNGKPLEKRLPEDPYQQLSIPQIDPRPYNGRLFCKDFTFDHFVVGGNNDFAYSAALSLAANRKSQQNTLFLLSKTGLGKSHLSQAIGHHILTARPQERVYYITAEDFTNEMTEAFKSNSLGSFKTKYRSGCDVLLLEDVQYLTGKERTQIELALALETLIESGKKIIFSSCCLPAEIPKLNDKLRSLLTYGLISTIDPPDFKTRIRILKHKAKCNGYHLPADVIQFLASELVDNVRQLESGLVGVAAKSSLLGSSIDLNLAESVVKNIVRQQKRITIGVIKALVCTHFQVSAQELVSSSRKHRIVRPRQIAIYLSRRYTDHPLQAIGKSFNRYHATALHAIGAVERGMKSSRQFRKQVEIFCGKLESGDF